jgi:hypothetical protein
MPINAQRDIDEYIQERVNINGSWDYKPLPEDEHMWIEDFKMDYGYDPYQERYEQKPERPPTPKVGHLVRFPADVDLIPTGTTGIIVDTRGIEIQVMMPDNDMVWIRRGLVEVISDSR